MTKRERLTSAEQLRLVEFRQQWFQIGISTERADRQTAERAITVMYSRLGKPPPVFVWCQSPATCLLAIHVMKQQRFWASLRDSLRDSLGASLRDSLGASLRDSLGASLGASLRDSLRDSLGDSLRDSLGASLRDSLGASLHDSLWASLRDSLGASLWASLRDSLRDSLLDSLGASLHDSLWASLRDSLRDSLGDSLRDSLGASLHDSLGDSLANAWWGQHEAYWISFYLFCRDVLGVKYADVKSADLDLWRDIATSCCWWFTYDHYCVVSERPTAVCMNERERIHCATGPAIAFADGWSVWAWHGPRVPQRVIEQPETITVAEIDAASNVELRRVLIERYGQARYLLDSAYQVIRTDDWGTLYRKPVPDDEDLVMVKVVNSTPEPDGSFKGYFLRVPPLMRTAREAVAWTFGVEDAEKYAPAKET